MNLVSKNPILVICVTGFVASLGFSVLIYPHIAGALDSKLANDGYDQLAYGLERTGTLSFYPDPDPTVLRGPAYPLFIAGFLRLGESAFPLSVQVGQALLHALTLLFCYQLGLMVWNRRAGLVAAAIAAVHPFLLWYTPRIVTETLATFLFTLTVLLFLAHSNEQSVRSSMRLGMALGISALCKQTFLPLLFIIPLTGLLLSHHPKRHRNAIIIFALGILLVAPWTMRNHTLTGAFIPVHGLLGFNLKQGDCLAERYEEAPLSYMKLIDLCGPHIVEGDTVVHWEIEKHGPCAGVEVERKLAAASVARYLEDPAFFLKKVMVNGIMFWTIGSTPPATVVTSLLQIPLLITFLVAARKLVKTRGIRQIHTAPLLFILVYIAGHLPIYALARFSLVLVPVMLAYAAGVTSRSTVSSVEQPVKE